MLLPDGKKTSNLFLGFSDMTLQLKISGSVSDDETAFSLFLPTTVVSLEGHDFQIEGRT